MEVKVNDIFYSITNNSFLQNSISEILIEQFNKSHKIKIPDGWIGFYFYYDYAFVLTTNSKMEISCFYQINYETMINESFLKCFIEINHSLTMHFKRWFIKSQTNLIRKDIIQSLLFNRLKVSYNPFEDVYCWSWKSYNISLQMNKKFVFDNIIIDTM